jgi:hypothetical protein
VILDIEDEIQLILHEIHDEIVYVGQSQNESSQVTWLKYHSNDVIILRGHLSLGKIFSSWHDFFVLARFFVCLGLIT